jgi:hypothetical protein
MMMRLLIRWLLSFATIAGIIRDELNLGECGCELLLRKVKDLGEATKNLQQEVEAGAMQFEIKNDDINVHSKGTRPLRVQQEEEIEAAMQFENKNDDMNHVSAGTRQLKVQQEVETEAATQFESNDHATVQVAAPEDLIKDDDEIANEIVITNNHVLPPEHRIEPITIDLPMTKAMEGPYDLCSFKACTDYINLFSRGQQYHLLSNVHAPTLPKNKCRQAFIVSSMPYAGSELQMLLIEKMLTKAGKKFRSHIYYNFHAHAELSGRNSLQWIEDFNDFLSTVDSEEFLVIRAPYKDDDESASQICSSSIKINSMRSLVDIALLRFHPRIGDVSSAGGDLPVMNLKEIMDYIRTLLMHQRHWAKNAINVETIMVDDKGSMMRFLSQMCEQIGDIDNCNDEDASIYKDLMDSNEIIDAVKVMVDQEIHLRNIYNSTDDQTKRVQNEVSQVFRSWIESHSTPH